MKTFHFLSGLPRSGATLLSAVLNQNKSLYVSPQTDLLWQMTLLMANLNESETYKLGQMQEGYRNVLKQLPHNFYAHINTPIVIDKNRSWGTSQNLEIARFINPDFKMIVLRRPILEILASFVRQCESNPSNNFIDSAILTDKNYSMIDDINEARCEWLMRPEGEIQLNILSVREAERNIDRDRFCVIEYKDLVQDTKTQIAKIYNFLGLQYFEHTYENIMQDEKYEDMAVYGLPNLHHVKRKIERSDYSINTYLSERIIAKYQGLV